MHVNVSTKTSIELLRYQNFTPDLPLKQNRYGLIVVVHEMNIFLDMENL